MKKIPIMPALPKVPSLDLGGPQDGFDNKGAISPESNVLINKGGVPMTRVEMGIYHLEQELILPDYPFGSSVPTIDAGASKTTEFEHIIFAVVSRDYKLSGSVTIKNKPKSNQFKIRIDTNLYPYFVDAHGANDDRFVEVYWSPTNNYEGQFAFPVPHADYTYGQKDAILASDPMCGMDANNLQGRAYYLNYDGIYLHCEFEQPFFDNYIWPVTFTW